jgi:hypothetical protein
MERVMHAATQETHGLIASDGVEGAPVRSSDGTRIGTIERLMIDKLTGNVAYAVLRLNAFGMGQERLPIPWARLTYDDRNLGGYRIDLTEIEISGAPSDESHKEFDWGDRDEIHGPYWGIAERW